MSKAVSISEGGKGRIFPQTDKLKVNNVGGGNSLWLPEDEVVTGTLYADENGIYLAENDGFSCYDTVVVRVEDETDPYDPDWELDPDDLDEDVWDEESLEEFQEDPEAFEEKFNDKEKWKAEKAKEEKSQKIKKVKSLKPSKITGIDPVDGNPYQVGVDPEGNLTKEMLPSSIHIVVAPWKRDYVNGEEINFYGMHVYLLDKDGHPFKTEQYPTGEIPFEELLLPVTTADGEGEGDSEYSDRDGTINSVMMSSSLITDDTYGGVYRTPTAIYTAPSRTGAPYPGIYFGANGDATWLLTRYDNKLYAMLLSGSTQISFLHMLYNTHGSHWYWHGSTNTQQTVKNTFANVGAIYLEEQSQWLIPLSTKDPDGHTYDEMIMQGHKIPVQFMRSDGEMLEDHFSITITEEDNETNSGSEHSGTSDSGSGHSSGGF